MLKSIEIAWFTPKSQHNCVWHFNKADYILYTRGITPKPSHNLLPRRKIPNLTGDSLFTEFHSCRCFQIGPITDLLRKFIISGNTSVSQKFTRGPSLSSRLCCHLCQQTELNAVPFWSLTGVYMGPQIPLKLNQCNLSHFIQWESFLQSLSRWGLVTTSLDKTNAAHKK